MRDKILLFPVGESSGGAGDQPSGPRTEPTTASSTNAPASPAVVSPAAAPPPAATTVIEGEVTEDSVKLKKQLEDERAERRRVERDHASVSDEFKRYKDATEARTAPPTNVPVKPGKVEKEPKYRLFRRRG